METASARGAGGAANEAHPGGGLASLASLLPGQAVSINGSRPLVISHRTNMGSVPENSLDGIDAAFADRADGVEVDVRATADGELVLMHDESLLRTTGDPRLLENVTAAELNGVLFRDPRTGQHGGEVPTLGTAIDRVAGRGILVVDVTQRPIEREVIRFLRRFRRASIWVWTADPVAAAALRAGLTRSVEVSLIVNPESAALYGTRTLLDAAKQMRLGAVVFEADLIDEHWAAETARRGLRFYSGATDDPATIERVASAGAQIVSTNLPAVAVGVLDGRASRAIGEDAPLSAPVVA
jgi:glycerophosphoryl diester phosphodiesterase